MADDKFYEHAHGARTIYDEQCQQEIYEYIFQPAFRESANLSRTAYFTSFLAWTGKVRELALADIGPQLVEQIATADWGLVTNWAQLQIVGEVHCFERVLARFRIGKVAGAVIPLRCEFFKLREDNSEEPLGVVEQDTTWVEVIGHGQVKPAEFPDYLADYLERTRQRQAPAELSLQGTLSGAQNGMLIYQATLRPGGLPVLAEDAFMTTLEESNLVGNVYYGNYFIWQGRVRDQWLNAIAPEYLRGNASEGELLCTYSRLDYLRDAMPFDKVYVTLSVYAIYENKLIFHYQYYRSLPNGGKEKLAVGRHEAIWGQRVAGAPTVARPIPGKIMDALRLHVEQLGERLSA